MRKQIAAFLFGLGLAAAVLIPAGRVHAALGEAEGSVSSDENALSAKRVSKTVFSGYTVKQIDSDAISVREYVTQTGLIFAVAWNGVAHPDLTPLLGRYADEYENSLKNAKRKHGHRQFHVETSRIVVEKWGQMRNLQGRDYIPALIPAGVTVDEIR